MPSRLLRSKKWLLLSAAVSGLLVALLAAPLYAGNPKTKKQRTHQTKASSTHHSTSTTKPTDPASDREPVTIDVLKGLQTGQLAATAKGRGDGKITLSLTNKTDSQLRVILPPGVIFSGASGQFGGGMGGMGGGMGGMGGGMGGMGGGMGGMGGGRGGMGGGMMGGRGGGMMGSGTMPASMGMMMLARLIMYLAGDYESWDQRSLMIGMMGMRGGMGMGGGMGGMGGGMGGMGGGMGGMGMMSVPATGPLETTLKPRQERHLPTAIVSMNGPDANSQASAPADGETLRISAIEQWTDDKRTLAAFKQLAKAKAPPSIAQMVMWYVTAGADWDDVGRLSQGWGNASEIALARQFVADLSTSEAPPSAAKEDSASASALKPDPGTLYWDIKGDGDRQRELTDGLRALWGKVPVLGLTAKEGVPPRPGGPALACQFEVAENSVDLKLTASHPSGTDWILIGKSRIKLADVYSAEESLKDDAKLTEEQRRERKSFLLGDALAKAMVARLVRVQLSRGPRVKGKESFRVKIVNESPMILNGLALAGSEIKADSPPAILLGMSLPPLKSLTVPATAEVVARLNLKEGSRVVAVDLSGL